jgi:DNA mismatch endonuclease, patch repair protein
MARIKSKNTGPERRVRSLLHRMGFRFRLHGRGLPGHPDVVLPKYGAVVFVHGCFWHRHEGCKYAYVPKTRKAFWMAKFEQNVTRDARVLSSLKALGWKVLVVWECELRDEARIAKRVLQRLRKRSQ